MTTSAQRPSLLVGMNVKLIQNEFERRHDSPVRRGKVVDVLYAITGYEGMIDERIRLILLLDNGRLMERYVNQVEADSDE